MMTMQRIVCLLSDAMLECSVDRFGTVNLQVILLFYCIVERPSARSTAGGKFWEGFWKDVGPPRLSGFETGIRGF
jgi:hypothetical protein